jgi:hypothetical protein
MTFESLGFSRKVMRDCLGACARMYGCHEFLKAKVASTIVPRALVPSGPLQVQLPLGCCLGVIESSETIRLKPLQYTHAVLVTAAALHRNRF